MIEERRAAEADPRPGREAEHELDLGAAPGPAQLAEGRVETALEVDALKVAPAPERTAARGQADLHHSAPRREREVDPRIAHQREPDGRAQAVVAVERGADLQVAGRPRETLLVDAVRREQP